MRKRAKKIWAVILLVLVAACSAGINLFTDNDELNFGGQFDQEIRNDPKTYPIYKGNPVVKEYIDKKIFHEILASPEVKKAGVYHYQLEIIQNDTTLNAFAVPGGYVYVYTGLIKYLDSEAALAGAIGHEIAHAERRHATQRMTKTYGLQVLAGIALGENSSQIASMTANLLSGLMLLANSRADEDEADQFSIKYLSTTRFYPGGVKFFFEKLRDDGKVAKKGQGIGIFLSTHPDPIARISSTEQRISAAGLPVKTYKENDRNFFKNEYKRNILDKMR